jgi:hypothetical protein
MGYRNQPNLAWRLVFDFPRSRFMSIETYTTTKKRQYDAQFDFEFEPDDGSQNPFKDGVPMDAPNRSLEVRLVPAEGHSQVPNVVHISPTEAVHAVYFRVYVPNEGVTITDQDLPRAYPYNVVTGDPMACPEAEPGVIFAPDYPQAYVGWVLPKRRFRFKSADDSIFSKLASSGNNAAILSYQFALDRVQAGRVVVVHFRAPTFFDTWTGQGPFQATGDTRYWSLCTQNLVKGMTLNCLPDYLAPVDESGFVTVVIGRGERVASAARERGFAFLQDKRGRDQPVMQLIYRNLLPEAGFAAERMYKGDYVPEGKVCTEAAFLGGDC